jgi:hypothetical protein
METLQSRLSNWSGFEKLARTTIIKNRRDVELDSDEARRLYDRCDELSETTEHNHDAELLTEIFGPEWWFDLPEMTNPDYEYELRIIDFAKHMIEKEKDMVVDAALL